MKKGDTVWVKDSVGAPAQLKRGSEWTVKSVQRNGLTIKLNGFNGAPFNIHRFTTVKPTMKISYHW